MVHWPIATKSMSLAKSIHTSSTVLSKKGCYQSHYSSPSRINKHHLSTHRSQVTSSTPSSSTSTPKHLFNAKPKDSIFDENDVNQICLHLKNQKLSLNHTNNNNHNHNHNQSRIRIDQNDTNNNQNNHDHIPCEYKEDEINEAFSKRMPNQMNEILSRSKSMHELKLGQLRQSWSSQHHNIHNQQKQEKIKIDNNLNITNILPGGISMRNIDKFEHDDDDNEQLHKYPQNNIVHGHQQQNQDGKGSIPIKINIKHSPWDDNLTWNAINITL